MYLATDELQSPVRRRFFLFSSTRRASATSSLKDCRSSCASLASLGSQGGSPAALLSTGHPAASKKRPKGMAGLIRASRRSTKQSSIIRQNGDIIIVKAGKIVSIRREQELRLHDASSSPSAFLPHQPLFPGNGAAGRGVREVNGLLNDGGLSGGTGTDDPNILTIPGRASCASSEGSDNVFDDSASHIEELPSSVDQGANRESFSLEMISEERRLLSQTSEQDQMETNVDRGYPSREHVVTGAGGASNVGVEGSEGKQLANDVGIIISIDEDNSVLNVMPLTPRTRDHITRSDLFLGVQGRGAASSLAPQCDMRTSHSAQGLCKRSLLRLPSVEHLDPPIRLKRASSDYNVHQGSGGFAHLLKPASSVSRRWSFGKRPERDPEAV